MFLTCRCPGGNLGPCSGRISTPTSRTQLHPFLFLVRPEPRLKESWPDTHLEQADSGGSEPSGYHAAQGLGQQTSRRILV